MKKIIALLLVLSLAFCFVACKKDEPTPETPAPQGPTTQDPTTQEPTMVTYKLATATISKELASRGGSKIANNFAVVIFDATGKVVAARFDSIETAHPTVTDGAIVAPATPAVSKNDQGEEYSGMPAGPWYKQAQAFANSFVGKTVDKLADLPASGVAGCTVYAGGYKATLIKAAGYAR